MMITILIRQMQLSPPHKEWVPSPQRWMSSSSSISNGLLSTHAMQNTYREYQQNIYKEWVPFPQRWMSSSSCSLERFTKNYFWKFKKCRVDSMEDYQAKNVRNFVRWMSSSSCSPRSSSPSTCSPRSWRSSWSSRSSQWSQRPQHTSHMHMQFGQFLDHDISITPEAGKEDQLFYMIFYFLFLILITPEAG